MTKERNDGAEVLTVGTFREGLSKLEGDISRLAAEMGLLRQQGTNLESRMTVIEARMGGRLANLSADIGKLAFRAMGSTQARSRAATSSRRTTRRSSLGAA